MEAESAMEQDPRIPAIQNLIEDFVKSPSLRHLKDPHSISRLARSIVRHISGSSSIWIKWTPQREQLVKSATECWVPVEDLRDHLNKMDGLALTSTDVEQRLKAFREEPYARYPNETLQQVRLALSSRESSGDRITGHNRGDGRFHFTRRRAITRGME